jgi:putative DNA primase/helicase
MTTFQQALKLAGLIPRVMAADGRIRRCATEGKPGKRNGWYVLHADGRGCWGDWTSGSGDALGYWSDESSTCMKVDQSKLFAVREEERIRERNRRVLSMRGACEFWARAKPMNRLHPYIDRKGLKAQGCGGLRESGGLLVVPVWHGKWLISVQTISEEGDKRFWTGAPVKGGSFLLDRPHAAVTAVVEGLATGLAVYQAVRQARVFVAFDAGNMLPVVDRIRPTGSVVLCADNDHGTMAKTGTNPGLEKARNAAELIGAGVAYPEGISGTDFADYLKEVGEGAPRQIERLVLSRAAYVPTPV